MWRPAVVASAIVTHVTALGAGFVWLDHAHIEGKLATLPPHLWPALFTHGFAGTGYWRPLTALSLSVDALASSPLFFHLTSIAWHAVAALMLFHAAQVLGLARRAAGVAGILFAVHPVSALVADAIAFRSEAMLAVALFTLVFAHEKKRPRLAVAAIVLGALTKETMFVLAPLFVFALELGSPKRRGMLLAEATSLAVMFGIRTAFAPAWRASQPALGFGDALGTRFASVAKSAAAIVLPIDRSICDAFPITHAWQPTAIAGAVALGAVAWQAWRRRGIVLLLALSLVPLLQIVPVSRWWSPHYLYVPLAFVAMLVARAIEKRTPLVAVIGVVLGGLTLREGLRYEDDVALWTPEVLAQPMCREGQFYLGEYAQEAGDWDLAAKHYEAALAPNARILAYVDERAALENLGVVRAFQRRFADARRAFASALERTQDEAARRELTYNLAAATFEDGDRAGAARLLEPEIARPDALPAAVELHRRATAP